MHRNVPGSSAVATGASGWVLRYAAVTPGIEALDVACGSGRHARWLAAAGANVTAVDRDAAAVATLEGVPGIVAIVVDLAGAPWPFAACTFGLIVVTNYLHRPLFPTLLDALAPGGRLLYETFAVGNERFGRPSNPDFLLRPGELLALVRGRLQVVAFEDLEVAAPKPAMVQRICAVRPP